MRPVVGIFSREGDRSFSFLSDALRAENSVRAVRSFTITNTGRCDLYEEVSRCDFAILYHSKNRGRLNLTNVTDSLYDEEITELSRELGREKVIVVADDLDSSSSEMKMRILQGQPLIEEMAAGLFLISKEDKTSPELLQEKLQKIISFVSRQAPNTSGENLSVQTVMAVLLYLYNTVIVWVTTVMSILPLPFDTVIVWIMMPVRVMKHVCNLSIEGVMMPVRVILLVWNLSIEGVMFPVRIILLVWNQSMQGFVMVQRFVLIICNALTLAPRTSRQT